MPTSISPHVAVKTNPIKHTALSAALDLAERGMVVFPVSGTGVPLVKWSEHASTDPVAVEAMWREIHDNDRWNRDAPCVGIACGPSGIIVLDNDRDDGGDDWFGTALMEQGDEWVRTPTARTPSGGEHLYYNARGLRLKSTVGKRGGIAPGIDTRAHGGMVIAPGSTAKKGVYQWQENAALGESPLLPVPEFIAKEIVLPPIPERRKRSHESSTNYRNSISITSVPVLTDPTPAILTDLDRDDAFIWVQAWHLGILDVPLGTSFNCVIHGDTRPSAALYRLDSGHIRYHDFHAQGTLEEWLTLAEVYHAQMSGAATKVNAPSHVVWQLRLLYECGLIDPVEVALPPLPDHANDSVRKAYEGFRRLCGLRWLVYPEREQVAYSPGFVAAWCDFAVETAKVAIRALVAMNVIEVTGTAPSAFGKRTSLYLPVACR